MRLRPRPALAGLALALTTAAALALSGPTAAGAATPPVGMGDAAAWAVLAGSTVTNTGPSTIGGTTGVSPGSAITGFPPGLVVGGTMHAADAVAAQAKADMSTAYDDAAGRGPGTAVATELGGRTLVPGVYTGPALGITGALTLDAQGDPSAVFVLQASSTLITATGSSVQLIGGASGCNVVWTVGSSATLGTASSLVGTVIARQSISAGTSASVVGRLVALTGAVTLDTNVITRPDCAAGGTTGGTTAPTSTTAPATTAPATTTPASATSSSTPTASEAATSPTAGTTGPRILAATQGAGTLAGRGGVVGDGIGTGTGTSRGAGTPSTASTGQVATRSSSSQALARTGVEVGAPITLGLLSLVAGGGAVLVSRRRPRGGRHRR